MKKTIITIMMLTCFCMASFISFIPTTQYFEGKWYLCYVNNIKPVVEKLPKCSTTNGECVDYDAKGNEIHGRWFNDVEWWADYDAKGNMIHRRSRNMFERRYFEGWFEYDGEGNMIHWWYSDGSRYWAEYDTKGNKIHMKNNKGREEWYKWFFDKKNNKKYQCYVDEDGNPKFDEDF